MNKYEKWAAIEKPSLLNTELKKQQNLHYVIAMSSGTTVTAVLVITSLAMLIVGLISYPLITIVVAVFIRSYSKKIEDNEIEFDLTILWMVVGSFVVFFFFDLVSIVIIIFVAILTTARARISDVRYLKELQRDLISKQDRSGSEEENTNE